MTAYNVNSDHQDEDKAGTQNKYCDYVDFEEMNIGDGQIIEVCRFVAFNFVENKIRREVSEDEQCQTRHDDVHSFHVLAGMVDNDRQTLESYAHLDEQVEHGQTRGQVVVNEELDEFLCIAVTGRQAKTLRAQIVALVTGVPDNSPLHFSRFYQLGND